MEYQKPQAKDTVARVLGTIGTIGTGLDVLAGGRGLGLFGRDGCGDRRDGYPAPGPYPYYAGCCEGDRPVTEREAKLRAEIAAEQDKTAKLEAVIYTKDSVAAAVAPIYAELNKLQGAVIRTADKLECLEKEEKRDVGDVYRYVDCTFIPQEKGYMDGRKVNYHGVRPELILKPGFKDDFGRRFGGETDGCRCEG